MARPIGMADSAADLILKDTAADRSLRFERFVSRLDRSIRAAFVGALEAIRRRLSLRGLAELIERRRVGEIFAQIGLDSSGEVFEAFEAAINQSVLDGARFFVQAQPPVTGADGSTVEFVANALNPRLVRFAQTQSSRRVREVSNQVRGTIAETIARSTAAGANPLETARYVRGIIGLTTRQARAVNNYRRMLEQGSAEALTRGLRDRGFDRSLRAAAEGRRPLTPEQIERQVERYRARYLQHRAEAISRTEAIRSANGSAHELLVSYVESGRLLEAQIRREWVVTRDARLRDIHAAVPGLNPGGVGLREPFQTPLGPMMYPGDPAAEAANVINCRCTVFTRIISREIAERRGLVPRLAS